MDVEDRVPVLLAHLEGEVVAQDPCVVDQDVDPPEAVGYLLEGRLDLLRAGDVAGYRERLGPGRLYRFYRLPSRLRREVHHRNVGTLLRKPDRLGCPDAPRRTRHDRYPPAESHRFTFLASRTLLTTPQGVWSLLHAN